MIARIEHSWRIRIRHSGRVAGAALLITSDTAVTCAHVVSLLLGANGDRAPETAFTVDFPGSRRSGQATASVRPEGWVPPRPDGGDLALLGLDRPAPSDVQPAPLRPCGPPGGRRVRAFGHPSGLAGGVWTRAELVGFGGPASGWVQLDGLGTGEAVAPGFSGAGVVDEHGNVIGIVAVRDRTPGARVAWMIPVEVVAAELPAVRALVASAVPAGGVAGAPVVGFAEVWRLAAAVAAVPVMSDERSRQLVVQELRPEIAGGIPRHAARGADVFTIVRTCLGYAGGLSELVLVIRTFAGDARAMRGVDDLIRELGLDGA